MLVYWYPPVYAKEKAISYSVGVEPSLYTGVCIADNCTGLSNFTLEYNNITIEGLARNVNYTIVVAAVGCSGIGPSKDIVYQLLITSEDYAPTLTASPIISSSTSSTVISSVPNVWHGQSTETDHHTLPILGLYSLNLGMLNN